MTPVFEYRLASGWITKAALEGSDAYALENFPQTWDQPSLIATPWLCLDDDLCSYPDYLEYTENLDGSLTGNGWLAWKWGFKFLTSGMQYYLKNTTFGGLQTTLVTVKTRLQEGPTSEANMFGVYQCYAHLPPRNTPNNARVQGGALDYMISFYNAVQL